MTDPIDADPDTRTALRTVVLHGPPGGADGKPIWTLVAGAPHFDFRRAFDAARQPSGVMADHAHPIRVLAADPPESTTRWRRPRLVDLHLAIGAVDTTGDTGDYEFASERLLIRVAGTSIDAKRSSQNLFTTIVEDGDDPGGHPLPLDRGAGEAPFVHVVGGPLADSYVKPAGGATVDEIAVPPMRLVAGRVGLTVRTATPSGTPTVLAPLLRWGIEPKGGACELWLTPDGLEFDATLPFPGIAPPKLQARVRLSAVNGEAVLDFLRPAGTSTTAAWLAAWRRITPANPEALVGLRLEARTSSLPAFRWTFGPDGKPSTTVRIPGEAFRIELVGPEIRGTIDGVATLHPRHVEVDVDANPAGGGFRLDLRSGMIDAAVRCLTIDHSPDRMVLDASMSTFFCSIDDDGLARALRDACGLETPPRLPVGLVAGKYDDKHEPKRSAAEIPLTELHASDKFNQNTAAGLGFERPLLAAFVPLADGWLQCPVPNLGPIDPQTDTPLIVVGSPAVPPPGAFSGYLRLRDAGRGGGTLSAWNDTPPPQPPETAPWQVTIEHAGGIEVTVWLGATADERATVLGARATLYDIALSTRGLLWISADRPDALEALPRAGAGPGAYLDVPLEGRLAALAMPASSSVLGSRLTGLRITGHPTSSTLDAVETSLEFDAGARRWANEVLLPAEARSALAAAREVVTGDAAPASSLPWPAVAWQRHAVVPLVAQMPMTRAAAGAIRPLESRDLIPRVVASTVASSTVATSKWCTIARLARSSGEAYARLLDAPGPLVEGWPTDDTVGGSAPVRGVAWAALGLPGVEVRPGATPPGDEAAVRFDLPLLDEAFASAALPPAPPVPNPDRPAVEPPAPPPTALDWPALREHWRQQERRLQNARVEDSYLAGFRHVGAPSPTDVKTLIRDVDWAVTLGVETAALDPSLPYGRLTIDQPSCGNEALLGFSGAVAGRTVLGFAPSSFLVGDRLIDNRGVGASMPDAKLLTRPVVYPGAPVDARLLTVVSPIDFTVSHDGASLRLGFWFKDLLVAGGLARLPAPMDFGVWNDGEKLVATGLEWRLAPLDPPGSAVVTDTGRHEIPFFGFRLEALRLAEVTLGGGGEVESVTLLCRLGLGPSTPTAGAAADRVRMHLKHDAIGTWQADFDQEDATTRLSLLLPIDGDPPRVVTLSGRLSGAGFAWNDTRLGFRIAGRGFDLPATVRSTVDTGGERVEATFERTGAAPALGSWLAVERAALTIDREGEKLVDRSPSFELAVAVAIRPPSLAETKASDKAASIPVDTGAEPWFHFRHTPGARSIDLFGTTLDPAGIEPLVERDGAIVVRAHGCKTELRSVPALASLGLLARLAEQQNVDGAFELVAGVLCGEIAQNDELPRPARLFLSSGRIRFEVARRRRGDTDRHRWTGTVTVDGIVDAENSLRWPALHLHRDDFAIKVPRGGKMPNDGRTTIRPADPPAPSAVHRLRWTFAGHRLPIELAAALARNDATTAWFTPVTTVHELTRGKARLRWRSIETVALGAVNALIPPLHPAHPEDDDTTFAARYRFPIDHGRFGDKPDAGMVRPGVGRIATVLQGVLGGAFRQAFDGFRYDGLMLVGGFLGLLRTSCAESAPLLRLPVVVGYMPTVEQTALPLTGLELAWADGPAARFLAIGRPDVPTPANASLDALTTALRAGSRAMDAPKAPGALGDDPVGALLVEQSFANPTTPETPVLGTTPFFLASAVGVERLLASIGDARSDVHSLSLVAGAIRRRSTAGTDAIPLAAAVAMPPGLDVDLDHLPTSPSFARRETRIALLGDDLTVEPWTGPPLAAGDGLPTRAAEQLAEARHAVPGAALFESEDVEGNRLYLIAEVGGERLSDAPEASSTERTFPDAARGFPCLPEPGISGEPAPWLRAPLESPTTAVRDDLTSAVSSAQKWTSGIAGLTQRIGLPGHAGTASDKAPTSVWICRTQVPAYLDLEIRGLSGPPLAWLQPAPAQLRLPRADELQVALEAASPATLGSQLQGFLPSEIESTALGERAGILTVRRTRLLAELGGVQAFDASQTRFGRMAQAGPSLARTMRTPRPAPLPANRGDGAHDRRVQADRLRPRLANHAYIGSADTLGGERLIAGQPLAWVLTAVAAPEWESTVSDAWDGSVRLRVLVEYRRGSSPTKGVPTSAGQVLAGLLTGPEGNAPAPNARLRIGDTFVVYRSLRIENVGSFIGPPNGLRSGIATVVLDPNTAPGVARPPHPDIVAAFSNPGPLPTVELQWTLRPGDRSGLAPNPDVGKTWTFDATQPFELPRGSDVAPVTLRMPLYPTTEARGALPLTPVTVLFVDAAYDRDLAGPPVADTGRIATGARLPAGRGELMLQLIADRGQAHRLSTVTFLLDVRFERAMDDAAQAQAESGLPVGVLPGGDLMRDDTNEATLTLRWLSTDAPPRELRCERADLPIRLGWVHELPLSQLTLADGGGAAALRAGDTLVVEVAWKPGTIELWRSTTSPPGRFTLTPHGQDAIVRRLTIRLTDDPVAEPPPALYAAMLRTRSDDGSGWRIGVPLCAQSPLPARIDPVDTARGLRLGMLKRRAGFVWTLMRPRADWAANAVAIVKSDRNGQTYLPIHFAEYAQPKVFLP